MEISSLEAGRSSREQHFVPTMAVSSSFASVIDRNDNLGQFSSMGRYNERAQQYLLDVLLERFAANWAEISKCVCSLRREVDPDTSAAVYAKSTSTKCPLFLPLGVPKFIVGLCLPPIHVAILIDNRIFVQR